MSTIPFLSLSLGLLHASHLPPSGSVVGGVHSALGHDQRPARRDLQRPVGTGTLTNPYVLFNAPARSTRSSGSSTTSSSRSSLGILLAFTSDYVTISHAPSFLVQYTLPGDSAALSPYGLPTFNYLQLELENTSHVSILNTPRVSGWLFGGDAGFAFGNVLLWNSSHDLIAGNHFEDMGLSIYVAGRFGNVIWGNRFTVSVPAVRDPLQPSELQFPERDRDVRQRRPDLQQLLRRAVRP